MSLFPSQPVETPTLSSSTETLSMESTTEAQPKSATTSKIRRLLPTSAWLRLWRRVKDATTTFVEQRRMSASRRETRKTSPSVSVPFPTKKVNTLAGTCGNVRTKARAFPTPRRYHIFGCLRSHGGVQRTHRRVCRIRQVGTPTAGRYHQIPPAQVHHVRDPHGERRINEEGANIHGSRYCSRHWLLARQDAVRVEARRGKAHDTAIRRAGREVQG